MKKIFCTKRLILIILCLLLPLKAFAQFTLLTTNETQTMEGTMWKVNYIAGSSEFTEYFIVGLQHDNQMLCVFQDAIMSIKGTGVVERDTETNQIVFDFMFDNPYNINYQYKFNPMQGTQSEISGQLLTISPANEWSATFTRIYPDTYTQSDIDQVKQEGYQEGIEACKNDPALCGITCDTLGCDIGSGSGCAILEENFDITIPCIDVFGTKVPIGLTKYNNPYDPSGYYWVFP